jgi:hypothetical protein
MIGMLDQFRHMLADLGDGLGVTDPVSGESVLELKTRSKTKKKAQAAKKKKKKAKKPVVKAKKVKKSTKKKSRK